MSAPVDADAEFTKVRSCLIALSQMSRKLLCGTTPETRASHGAAQCNAAENEPSQTGAALDPIRTPKATPSSGVSTDVLLMIVDALVPPTTHVALPADHAVTKALRAMACVSRAAYPVATRHLYARCLHIDAAWRLERLLWALRHLRTRAAAASESNDAMSDREQQTTRPLPSISILSSIHSLYLAPFPKDSINDTAIAAHVCDLFFTLAPTLQRLVIDIPLRSLYPEDDAFHVRPVLRHAFSQLTALETFCSVRDELFLDTKRLPLGDNDPPVWAMWPQLCVLALYNPALDWNFWPHIGRLTALRTLVATRADGHDEVDLKLAWESHCGPVPGRIELVNTSNHHRRPLNADRWEPGKGVLVREVDVPISYYGDEDPIDLCQEWIKRRALRDELEELQGKPFGGPRPQLGGGGQIWPTWL